MPTWQQNVALNGSCLACEGVSPAEGTCQPVGLAHASSPHCSNRTCKDPPPHYRKPAHLAPTNPSNRRPDSDETQCSCCRLPNGGQPNARCISPNNGCQVSHDCIFQGKQQQHHDKPSPHIAFGLTVPPPPMYCDTSGSGGCDADVPARARSG
jgi:hypothetical protein